MSTPFLDTQPWALKDGEISAEETGRVGPSPALLCPRAGQMFIYYARSSKAIYFVISLTYQ